MFAASILAAGGLADVFARSRRSSLTHYSRRLFCRLRAVGDRKGRWKTPITGAPGGHLVQ